MTRRGWKNPTPAWELGQWVRITRAEVGPATLVGAVARVERLPLAVADRGAHFYRVRVLYPERYPHVFRVRASYFSGTTFPVHGYELEAYTPTEDDLYRAALDELAA